jgi:pilus assembly protein CpaE
MRVIIVGIPEAMRERFRQVMHGTGLQCESGDCVSYSDLSYRILHGPADLIVFALGANAKTVLPLLQQARTQTKAPIIALGTTADAEAILNTLRSGATEYLHEADLREGLLAILGKMRETGSVPIQWGEIIAVLAAKPGIGVTTVSSNLAFALSAHYPGRVALAELGPQVPELALNLNVEPHYSLSDLSLRENRLDTTLLKQLLVDHPSQLKLLVHQPSTIEPIMLAPPIMRTVLVLLRTMYEYTVIDLGQWNNPSGRVALELASKVVVVVGLDVPTLRLSRYFLRELGDANIHQNRVVVVANRYGQRKQFPWKQAQDALGQSFAEWIPDDVGLINQALNLGQPLLTLSPRATITRRFDQLADRINGKDRNRATGVAG